MQNLTEEIGNFLSNTKYSYITKKRYKKVLVEFSEELAKMSDCISSELHLEKTYEIIDKGGKHICYKSIDSTLIDTYLFSKVNRGYHWLSETRSALGSFFKYLFRNYDFPNIMLHLKFRLGEYKQTEINPVLSRSQIIKFMNSVITNSSEVQRDTLLFVLLLSTGSRISEILGVRVENIDIENELIFLKTTKNKSSKNLVLRNGLGEIIQSYMGLNQLSYNSYLFNNNGKKLTNNYIRDLFHFYLDRASLPKTNIHSLRKSFATLMAESGTDILIIKQLLNHRTLSSTKTYIHPNYVRNMGSIVIKENTNIYRQIRR
jgi:site-specific recombinase XerD